VRKGYFAERYVTLLKQLKATRKVDASAGASVGAPSSRLP